MSVPSKKIITLGVACLSIVGVVIFIKVKSQSDELVASNASNNIVATQVTQSALSILKQQVLTQQAGTASSSITSSLSKEFAQNYLALQKHGQLSTTTEAELITTLALKYSANTTKTLQLNDISTFSDRDKVKVTGFGNAAARVIKKYAPLLQESPITLLGDAQASNDSATYKKKLLPISRAYRALALELTKIPAPANLVAEYVGFINGYIHFADDVDNMSANFDDAVRGFIGLNDYQQNFVDQINLLKNIQNYFVSNGILFSNTDDGSIWTSIKL